MGQYFRGVRLDAAGRPAAAGTAVVLVNLGTPDAPTSAAVRRYLAEFLWDPRVVEQPRWLWWLILNLVILRIRPRRSAHAYQTVWTPEGSPLLVGSRALTGQLAELLGGSATVRLAMRYGNPSVRSVLRGLADEGYGRLLVVPLYPQYSATTTASVIDAVGAEIASWRTLPELRWTTSYTDDPAYIAALAASVREHWAEHGRGERLLLSFHGIPQRYVAAGDPYADECRRTVAALQRALEIPDQELVLSFQSRVGREPWLTPYTDETLVALGKSGVKTIDALCPGFAVDCLETNEEIAIRGAEEFASGGGQTLRYIRALNDRADHARALLGVLRRAAGDWLEPSRP
jgi:ferrochelatase